ncbi:response regulator, partial [Escherichia coli]
MKPAILVVDDDVAVCELLQDVLSEHVFTVLTCHTGQEAVNRVQQDSGIALVLLDM